MANKKREKPKHLGRGLASLFDPITSGGAEAVLKSGLGTPEKKTEPQMPETKSEPGMPSAETEPQMPEAKSEPGMPSAETEPQMPEAKSEPGTPSAKTELQMPKTRSGPGMLSAKTVLQMLKTRSGLGMLRTKTALGIDISNTRINLALLKKGKNGVELLKTASGPVPDGAIKNGSIEDAVILSKAIKELKTRNKIQASQAAVSLFVRPVLVQIMDMPKPVPTNIRQFVQNEVKRCVALTGKEIALDFGGIGSAGHAKSRLFVVATDSQKVAELAKACEQARLNVEAIEPPVLAYIRAFYAERIAGKFDCNVLLAILNGSALTLCVFRKQTLDFVRTKDISEEKAVLGTPYGEPDELCQWLAEEINAIIRFYDTDVPDSPGKWEVTVVAGDCVQLPTDAEESLRTKVASADLHLQVRTAENACQDTLVVQDGGLDKPSVVAIGLALRFLGINGGSDLRINLLPPESAEVKSIKKHLLITANIMAAVLPLTILAGGVLGLMTKKVNQGIAYKKQTQLSQDTRALLRERELVDRQIEQLSGGPDRLKAILGLRQEVDWAYLLEDIRSRTPKALRITKLHSSNNSKMYLEGLALSYEAVHLFVDMLNKSAYINSASLSQTEKDNRAGGLVTYAINCSLTPRKER